MGPQAYVNRYRNAWSAAAINITAAVDDAKRRRHRGGIWVPTGTCGRLVVSELPAPLSIPKFNWAQLQVRGWQAACIPALRLLSPVWRVELVRALLIN
jgi:hypothetical protein